MVSPNPGNVGTLLSADVSRLFCPAGGRRRSNTTFAICDQIARVCKVCNPTRNFAAAEARAANTATQDFRK